MKRIIQFGLMLIACLLLFTACQNSPAPQPPVEPPKDNTVIIPESTKVMAEATQKTVEVYSEDGTLGCTNATGWLDNLKPGEIFVSSPIEGVAPDGMLRKLVSKETVDGKVILKTEPATLAQAIEKAALEFSGDFDETATITPLLEGVQVALVDNSGNLSAQQTDTATKNFSITLPGVIYSSGDQFIRLDGTINYSLRYTQKLVIELFTLKEFEASVRLTQQSNSIRIRTNNTVSGAKEVSLATITKDFDFMIGIVPVHVTVKATVKVGVDGQVTVATDFEWSENKVQQYGARFRDGNWTNLNTIQQNYTMIRNNLGIGSNVKAYVKVPTSVFFYDVIGPTVEPEAYVQIQSNALTRRVTVDAGLKGKVRVDFRIPVIDIRLPLFSFTFLDAVVNVFNFRVPFTPPTFPLLAPTLSLPVSTS